MKREDKQLVIDSLAEKVQKHNHFYLTDIGDLNAGDTSQFRRLCFKEDIQLVVVKNTLLRKALEKLNIYSQQYDDILKGHTSIMFSNIGNAPAKLIKEFRKTHKKPILKAAYVEESIYLGDSQLDSLIRIKSKKELIGDIVALLNSPIRNVLGSLQSGSNTIFGLLKTLEERK